MSLEYATNLSVEITVVLSAAFVLWVTVTISLPVILAAGTPALGMAVFGIAPETNFLNSLPSAFKAVTLETSTPAAP